MNDYVMFGHGPLFGDIVDIILGNGGRLKKVVQNIPENVRPGTKALTELIQQQERSRPSADELMKIIIQQLKEFEPEPGEKYLIGFRSHRLIPLRADLRQRFGLTFPPLVHPRAVVSPTARIGEGTFVGAGVVIGSGAVIGRFALLNRGCTIGHDCVLGNFVNVGPGANLASFVTLDQGVTIGIGAALVNWVKVGCHAVIAGGAAVIESVPAHTLVAGVPAKAKKTVNLDSGPALLD